jgi:hypothetical protein
LSVDYPQVAVAAWAEFAWAPPPPAQSIAELKYANILYAFHEFTVQK